jgi:YHS domain-containing protein
MKKTKTAFALTGLAMVATAMIVTHVFAGDVKHEAAHTTQQAAATAAKTTDSSAVKPYPLNYCLVSGEKLGEMGAPVVKVYNGQEIKFCCKMCPPKFEANQAKYLAKFAAAVTEIHAAAAKSADTSKAVKADTAKVAPAKLSKLDWCIVSGETLGEMGSPIPYTYKGRSLEFCCKNCIKKFENKPDYYMARLDSALAGQIQQPSEEE